MNIEYDKIYKAPYHNNGGEVCGYKVDKSDLDNLLQMLRTAEQERDQYKADLESLRAKIKQAKEQEPIAWCYPLDAENLKTTECIVEVYSIPVRCPDYGSTFALYAAPVIPD